MCCNKASKSTSILSALEKAFQVTPRLHHVPFDFNPSRRQHCLKHRSPSRSEPLGQNLTQVFVLHQHWDILSDNIFDLCIFSAVGCDKHGLTRLIFHSRFI